MKKHDAQNALKAQFNSHPRLEEYIAEAEKLRAGYWDQFGTPAELFTDFALYVGGVRYTVRIFPDPTCPETDTAIDFLCNGETLLAYSYSPEPRDVPGQCPASVWLDVLDWCRDGAEPRRCDAFR